MTPRATARGSGRRAGFTLVELALVIAVVGILAAIAGTRYAEYLERTRRAVVVVDLKTIATHVKGHRVSTGVLPPDLAAVDLDDERDAWDNSYVYLRLADATPGEARKDRFLVPINSDFDLYSKGADGSSVAPLTAEQSRDDVIRANDGSFYGLASQY